MLTREEVLAAARRNGQSVSTVEDGSLFHTVGRTELFLWVPDDSTHHVGGEVPGLMVLSGRPETEAAHELLAVGDDG